MGATLKVVSPVSLGNAEGDIYQVTAGRIGVIKSIVICNTDTSDRTVTLYAMNNGASSGVASTIFCGTVTAKETKVIGPDINLDGGGKIRGYASSASVVGVRVSSVEVV
jgi:hypothetical protein